MELGVLRDDTTDKQWVVGVGVGAYTLSPPLTKLSLREFFKTFETIRLFLFSLLLWAFVQDMFRFTICFFASLMSICIRAIQCSYLKFFTSHSVIRSNLILPISLSVLSPVGHQRPYFSQLHD